MLKIVIKDTFFLAHNFILYILWQPYGPNLTVGARVLSDLLTINTNKYTGIFCAEENAKPSQATLTPHPD